ncbi:MAG: tetratricopeptide repeat protein [Phycisphaerales bacterium]|nr:tetratricopeptide repeat protein [Phycisphaerales bacterium]
MHRFDPAIAQAHDHLDAGRLDQAQALLRRHLQRQPRDTAALNSLAVTLFRQGQYESALFYGQQAAAIDPHNPVYLETVGTILGQLARPREAAEVFRKGATLVPQHPGFAMAISHALWDAGDFEGALAASAEAVRLAPDSPGVHAAHISVLQNLGDLPAAETHARMALERFPRSAEILQALILTLNYSAGVRPEEMLEMARRYGAVLTAHSPAEPHAAARHDAAGPLRAGYISPDLRRHSVAYFIEPILEHHDRAVVQPFIYYTATASDSFTNRMRKLPLTWRDAGRLDPTQLAERIRQDRIDILVELSGHTIGHRLATMAARPAPVGITYLGYPNTTGVPGVDARLVDAITDPPGAEPLATERLIRLPGCFLCYRPDPDAPEPSAGPSLAAPNSPERPGPVVFGSFNNLSKLSDETVTLWTRVVNAVPGSRLVLKFAQADSDWLRQRFARRFEAAGLNPACLEILGKIDAKAGHLAAYARIDIALDPIPYAGTTTTCEALDMGVPVLTLLGRTHAGRVGASLLTAMGLERLIAADEAGYIELARQLAIDHAARAELRTSLRARLRGGPLCDAARFTRSLEAIYRELWAGRAQ